MTPYYKNHAMELFKKGYLPIPIRPKDRKPFFEKGETWQVDITEQVVAEWQANGKGGGGIGLTGLGALDFDILDKDVSNQLIKIVRENFGTDIAIRVGQPPKFLVPVSPKSGIDKKWKNVWFDQKNVEHKIEFLAPGAQYFVALGIHPDTKKEFKWVGQDILSMPADSLPVFENLDISMIEDAFDRIAEAKGWVRKGTHPKNEDSKALDDFANLKLPGDVPISDLKLLVDQLPQEACDDYDQWIRYGAAIHHASNGSDDGYQIFDEWSRKSTKYKDADDTLKRWNSWHSSRPGGATIGSIIKTVQDTGGMVCFQAEKSMSYEDRIRAAEDRKVIRAIMDDIKKDKTLDHLALSDLAILIRDRIRELKFSWKLPDIREMIRPRIKGMNEVTAESAPDWVKQWVYLAHQDRFCAARTDMKYTRSAFCALNDRKLIDDGYGDEERADIFALNRARVRNVHDALYWPGGDTYFAFEGKPMVNTYNPESRGDRLEPSKWEYDDHRAVDMLKQHILEMFPEPGDAQTLMDVMGYIAQKEGERIGWMLILYGCEGDGKTM
ncbi:MAG: PriCT-2 domain-containing protein, partial [Pseudomonadota bacterium]